MKTRIYFYYGLLCLGFLLLWGKAFELQIIFGSYNRALAEGNRIKKVVEPAPRGIIYDRKGKELVRNVPIYRVKEQESERVEEYEEISREEALKIEARGGKEAENLRIDIGRQYVYGPALAHVLGYLGADVDDFIGRTGIEEEYNLDLKGKPGGEVFEVLSSGEKTREIGEVEPIPGKDVHLSIDGRLSQVAFEALQGETRLPAGRRGAVVATDAKTGEVLVLVSSPSFNPEKITPEVLTDSGKPMFNRAISGVYPPGSTFKIVTATAGLEEGKIDANTIYEDTGQIRVGSFIYKNWYFTQYGKTEGPISIVRALKRSTDTFFYKVGEWVGAPRLAEWARAFGFGKPTGIDLLSESEGKIPDPSQNWYLGNTYHFAIGQADLLTTPLQVNMMASIIANDGLLCRPRVKDLPAGKAGQESKNIECLDLKLNKETLRLIKEGMKEACSSGGTAFPFFNFSPQVGCKSGTAEFGDPQNRTHAWLTAFAPVDEPEIVVTALVEAGGEGSYIAAPIVKKVMEKWFEK